VADQWELRFDNHPVWGALESLKSQLDSTDLPTDPPMVTARNRILRLITTVEAYRDAENNKDLFTSTMLQSVYNAITQYVTNPLAQYIQNPGTYPTSLTGAADNVDTVYDELAKWPALSLKGRAVAAGQAAAQFEDASTKALAHFREQTDQIEVQVGELHTRVDSEIAQVEAAKDQSVQQLQESTNEELASLRSQIADLENTITAHTKRLETFSDTTEDTLTNKLDEFGEWSKQRVDEAIADEIKDIRNQSDSAVARTKQNLEKAETLHSEVNKLTHQTRNLVQSFAERAVADDYQKNARNKSLAGWFWDILGFAVGAIPLVALLVHFLTASIGPDSLASLTLARVGISAAAVGVAALCFHRGSQNHKESRIAKRTDLRVRTVHSFLANLDPDVQQAVLEGMADQIYLQGKLDEPGPAKDDDDQEKNLLQRYLDKVMGRREKAEYEASQLP
jgi:Mg2+ and Co2+ transporter CorA